MRKTVDFVAFVLRQPFFLCEEEMRDGGSTYLDLATLERDASHDDGVINSITSTYYIQYNPHNISLLTSEY
jgi:hypothetical protein